MTEALTADAVGKDSSEYDHLEDAQERVKAALEALDLGEHGELYRSLQETYFDLEAALRARDPEFQDVDLDGANLYVPSQPVTADNPTAKVEDGEIEIATGTGSFSILSGIQVCEPNNPFVTHSVHIDHVVEDGDVEVQIDSTPLKELPSE